MNAANKLDTEEKKQQQQQQQNNQQQTPPWLGKSPDEGVECDEGNHTADEDEDRRVVLQLKRENTVKDLTQKLTAQNLIPSSPVEEKVSRWVLSRVLLAGRLRKRRGLSLLEWLRSVSAEGLGISNLFGIE